MSTATATKTTYRKTRKGEWVVCGPADTVRPGATVTVTKRSGETKSETIASVGKTFTADGVEQVYGYLDRPARRRTRPSNGWTADDHEDCLSFAGGCGPRCPHNFAR